MSTVKLGYESSSNITFHGEIDTGYTREEWDDLTEADRREHLTDAVFELVDIYVKDDE